jgi:hypothetical protein
VQNGGDKAGCGCHKSHLGRASQSVGWTMTWHLLVKDIFIDLGIAGGPSLLNHGPAFQRARVLKPRLRMWQKPTAVPSQATTFGSRFAPTKKHIVRRKCDMSFSRARR